MTFSHINKPSLINQNLPLLVFFLYFGNIYLLVSGTSFGLKTFSECLVEEHSQRGNEV